MLGFPTHAPSLSLPPSLHSSLPLSLSLSLSLSLCLCRSLPLSLFLSLPFPLFIYPFPLPSLSYFLSVQTTERLCPVLGQCFMSLVTNSHPRSILKYTLRINSTSTTVTVITTIVPPPPPHYLAPPSRSLFVTSRRVNLGTSA